MVLLCYIVLLWNSGLKRFSRTTCATWWAPQPLRGFSLAHNSRLQVIFIQFTQLNFTICGPCAVTPNGRSTRSWKVLEGKEKEDFGAQLSARRSLLLSVCSLCRENSGSVDRVNNMLSFSVKVFASLAPYTLYTSKCTAKLSLANWWFSTGDYWGRRIHHRKHMVKRECFPRLGDESNIVVFLNHHGHYQALLLLWEFWEWFCKCRNENYFFVCLWIWSVSLVSLEMQLQLRSTHQAQS